MPDTSAHAESYLPVEVSEDGMFVTLTVLDREGSQHSITMPSPMNSGLIADLQNANALARDRFLGIPGRSPGGAVRVAVRKPKTFAFSRTMLLGQFALVIDQGTSDEMVFAMPEGSEFALAKALVELLNQTSETPTKQ